jgi:BMFP domain-containing protein YqiC
MERKRTASIYPTADEITRSLRSSGGTHDLVTRCDISGDVQTIAILREDRDALQRRVEELEARIALQEREYLQAPIETD